MIQLTDEEMHKIIPSWIDFPTTEEGEIDWYNPKSGSGGISHIHRDIAKAQLKKVVEWGNESCIEHKQGMEFRRECYYCWQALLEEAK